jgi:hypothetical protein
MDIEAEFVEIGNVKKSGEIRVPGPPADVGKLVASAEEIRTIEWYLCADFVFITV